MALITARDLKKDVLFRAGENTAGVSSYDAKVIDYLNRVYTTLANGASEFLPEYVDDWWWMRARAVLVLAPTFTGGSVAVVRGATNAMLSVPPPFSLAGYRLRVDGSPDILRIASHTASVGGITLDAEFTGETSIASTFVTMKTTYTLSAAVAGVISPMIAFRGQNPQIMGTTPERMDALFPISSTQTGAPMMFAMEGDQTVRFSHGGLTDGTSMRVEYRYRPTVDLLTDSDLSSPIVPVQYRHLLADMALTYVMTDKNDDRAAVAAGSAKAGLLAMVRENRRRLARISTEVGTIRPRGGQGAFSNTGPVRTDSGLIIG